MTTLDRQFEIKKVMNGHFSHAAKYYRHLRTTDLAPINFIMENVRGYHSISAADIGCGAGRYSYNLLRHLDIRHLLCIDANEQMLRANGKYLRTKQMLNFGLIMSSAERIPLANSILDCVFTFNAIHHFDVAAFFNEAARIVKNGGTILPSVYTKRRNLTRR